MRYHEPRKLRPLERRAAIKAAAEARAKTGREWAHIAIGVTGVVVAVLGIWTWISEREARDEDREVRKAALIESAYRTIADLKPIEGERLLLSERLSWAMTTLVKYGAPVKLEASIIDLQDAALDCGDFTFSAQEVRLARTSVRRSRVSIEAEAATLEIDARESLIVGPVGLNRASSATFVTGVIDSSRLKLPGRSLVDADFRDAILDGGDVGNVEIVSGRPGILTIFEEELNDHLWPSEAYGAWEDWEARPGEKRKMPPLPVFNAPIEARPVGFSNPTGVTSTFSGSCPSGQCKMAAELPPMIAWIRLTHPQPLDCDAPDLETPWPSPPDMVSELQRLRSRSRELGWQLEDRMEQVRKMIEERE